MRTSKPISTISYNSKEFLEATFNKLYKMNKLAFWCAVYHYGETLDDGTSEKDHWHVYAEPNEKVDTMEIQRLTCENDPDHPDKPLKCIDFRPSKWEDWVWYTLHDAEYLRTKVEFREFAYQKSDYIYSDEDEFDYRFERAMHSGVIAANLKIRKMMNENSVSELCAMGIIQPNQAFHYAVYEQQIQKGLIAEQQKLNELERIKGETLRMEQLAKPIEPK